MLGVAPGADVDVMKVFGNSNVSFTSVILQGIDWAIQHDHADILSISIGFLGLPTSAAEQPLTAILENAIGDGTVVVASTGDSSPSNTESSPALDPGVIGAAGSTSYRIWAQTNFFLYDMAQAIHNHGQSLVPPGQPTLGWLDNEVSTLSSSGVTEDRRVPDVIAPGDLNWADCSTDTSTYTDCENFIGGSPTASPTSAGRAKPAPLTAGTAALVIQAYRNAHGNQTPTPAVVRRIIFSSATDLGVPAENQGAGLVNALRAVRAGRVLREAPNGRGPAAHPGLDRRPRQARSGLQSHGQGHEHRRSKAKITPVLRTLGQAAHARRRQAEPVQLGKGVRDRAPASPPPSTSPARRSPS